MLLSRRLHQGPAGGLDPSAPSVLTVPTLGNQLEAIVPHLSPYYKRIYDAGVESARRRTHSKLLWDRYLRPAGRPDALAVRGASGNGPEYDLIPDRPARSLAVAEKAVL